jgi:hypothetical protein
VPGPTDTQCAKDQKIVIVNVKQVSAITGKLPPGHHTTLTLRQLQTKLVDAMIGAMIYFKR